MAEKKVGIRYEVSGQDQLKRIAEILERIEKVNLRVAASMDALTQASQKYNQASGQAKTQLDSLSDATDQTSESIDQQLEAERLRIRAQRENTRAATEGRKSQEQLNQGTKEAGRAQKNHAAAIGMTIKKWVTWALGARTVYRLYMQLRAELRKGFMELYENTEEWKRLKETMDDVGRVVVSGLASQEGMRRTLDDINDILVAGQQAWLMITAVTKGASAAWREFTEAGVLPDWVRYLGPWASALDAITGTVGLLTGEVNTAMTFQEAFTQAMIEGAQAMEMSSDAADETKSKIDSLVSALKRWQATQARWAARAEEIQTDYRQAITSATGDMFAGLHKAQVDYQKAVDKINAKALKARAKAYKNYERALSKQQEQGQDERQRAAERHALEMDFARRRFNLTSLQNERIYQYTRSRLVADGDVLAIEDLDARYEIEQKAQKENFDLQMQQADAMYQLQMKYQNEAYRQQALLLKQALGEQLREIEEERQNEVVEAKDAADEQRQITKDEWADRVATAEANAIQQEEDLDESRQRDLKNQAEYLADIVANSDLSVDQVLAGHVAVYGANGELDKLTRDYVTRNETWAKLVGDAFDGAADTSLVAAQRLTDGWATSLGLIAQQANTAAAAVATIGSGFSGRIKRRRSAGGGGGSGGFKQYGGDTIVNQPTTFVAGEGHSPERVRVEPISPIGGGNVNLGWAGSAIPVHGTGQMDGMDLSGVGDAIAQGLVVELQRQVLSYRGKRGY